MFKFLRMLLAVILRTVVDTVTGLVRVVVEQLTHRDFAAEAAEQTQAEAAQVQQQNALDVAEARHDELVAVTKDQATEVRALRKALEKVREPVERPKSLAERRAEIAAQSRIHDVEVRSSTWTTRAEPEVDDALRLRVA